MSNKDYPHIDVRVDDQSSVEAVDTSTLGLHRPFFPIFAPKGPIGVPVWGSSAQLSKVFSSDIFNAGSALGNLHQMQFMLAAAGAQPICVMRMDDNSKALGFSLICIAQQKTVPAYKKDSAGNFVQADSSVQSGQKDSSGYAYQLDSTGKPTPVQNTWVYSYALVSLVEDDNGSLQPTDALVQEQYPDFKSGNDQWFEIARLSSATPGTYISRSAFALSLATNEDDAQSRIGMPLIRFYPKFFADMNFDFISYKNGLQSFTPTAVYNLFGDTYTDMVITANTVKDPLSNEDLGWQAQLQNAYVTSSGNALDYTLVFNVEGGFSAYGKTASPTAVKGVLALAQHMAINSQSFSPALTIPGPSALKSDWDKYIARLQAVNVLSGQTVEQPNDGALISSNLLAAPLGTSLINGALQPSSVGGGTGGQYSWLNAYDQTTLSHVTEISDAALDQAVQKWANSDQIQVFSDDQQYPINCVYDSGWSLNTKLALSRLQNVRGTIKIAWSCEDFSTPRLSTSVLSQTTVPTRTPMGKEAALSVGATLMTSLQSYTDSEDSNTRVFRNEIYGQSGEVNFSGNWVWLPHTYWRMMVRIKYYSGTSVSGTPKGRPQNEMSMFRSCSWVPTTSDLKQAFWSHGINCAYYATPTLLFMPDIRTVYSDESSLLSDGVYSDYIIFTKQICMDQWTYFVGRNSGVQKLTSAISYAIDNATSLAFSTYMNTKTKVTAIDSNSVSGTTARIETQCFGDMPDRIWDTILTAVRAPAVSSTSNQ